MGASIPAHFLSIALRSCREPKAAGTAKKRKKAIAAAAKPQFFAAL